MGVSDASEKRYASAHRIAAYMDAEWSDLLWPDAPRNNVASGEFDLNKHGGPHFYSDVMDFIGVHCAQLKQDETRFCDVGAGTGRFVYEWLRRFPHTAETVLCEPSSDMIGLARVLITKPDELSWVPMPDKEGRPTYRLPDSRPPRVIPNLSCVFFVAEPAEGIPRPEGYFHLVSCLNVVDRHRDPRGLMRTLGRLLVRNGLLVLASPMDWREEFTPAENQVDNLGELFGEGWRILAENNILYDFRLSLRRGVRYSSQVLIVRKSTP